MRVRSKAGEIMAESVVERVLDEEAEIYISFNEERVSIRVQNTKKLTCMTKK